MKDPTKNWEYLLEIALEQMLKDPAILGPYETKQHVEGTPQRVVKAYKDFFRGAQEDPEKILTTAFRDEIYDEVVIVSNVEFTSFCAHHLLPFTGQVHFGYMPDKQIVGLSKIPRLINALSRRLQVQESLSAQIVDIFYSLVKPKGCGVIIEAEHQCMSVRGVEKKGAITETTALRGNFKETGLKVEFLAQVAPRKGKR